MAKFIEVHDYSTGCTTLVNVDCIHSIPKVERTTGSKYTALYCDDEVIRVSETYTELRQMISNATGGVEWAQGASCSG